MRLASIASAAVLLFTTLSISAKTCEPQKILDQACEYFKERSHEAFIKTKEGTHYRNPLYQGEVPRNKSLSVDTKDKKRVQTLFDQSKQALRLKVLNGVPEDKLSLEKKNLLKRLDTVKLIMPEDQSKEIRIQCNAVPDNAYYVFATNSVAICEEYFRYPSRTLAYSLGHEISHAIDSCKCRHSLYQISRQFAESNEEDPEQTRGWDGLFGEEDKITLLAMGENKSLFQKVKGQKSGPGFTLLASEIPESKYPYEEERKCLLKKEGFQDRIPPKTDPQDCNMSQMNEAMSDAFGGYAFAAFNEKQPVNSIEEAYELFARADEELCDPAMKPRIVRPHVPDYPNTRHRFQSVVLKVPGVMEAFGCELKGESCFSPKNAKAQAPSQKDSSQSKKLNSTL